MIPISDTCSRAVAFTGHRTYDDSAAESLHRIIAELYAEGARTFLCGMAVGFDLAAAETVLACRAQCPGLELVCVIPFAGQENHFSPAARACYARVLAAADRGIILSSVYHAGSYARRNDYLVDHASTLVAWYDGSPGGTHYTVRRALRRGLSIRNLCLAAPALHRPAPPDPELF